MLSVLHHPVYRRLFLAQIVALLGTGLATISLGFLAYELAGGRAGLILSAIFTIKMVAYVAVAPVAQAVLGRWSRRRVMIGLDLVRAGVALCLPFVSDLWQIYALIAVLQVASAGFTPTFQATIPDILVQETDYTKALSLSRLAYDTEALITPMLAAALLVFVSFDMLFLGTMIGFVASALLIGSILLPQPAPAQDRPFGERVSRGIRIYLATPRLRGLLALSFCAAAAGAMVLVNTVTYVRHDLQLDNGAVAWSLAAFGAGSMCAALLLPRWLEHRPDRPVMICGAWVMIAGLTVLLITELTLGPNWTILLACWGLIGLGYGGVQTPSGRLLRRSSQASDRPALYAAHFALSHACWLVTYPVSGVAMTWLGATGALVLLTGLAVIAAGVARYAWPTQAPELMPHDHDDLPPDHPHLKGHGPHQHAFVIDDLHHHWPRTH